MSSNPFMTLLALFTLACLAFADIETVTSTISIYDATTLRIYGAAAETTSIEACSCFVGTCIVTGGPGPGGWDVVPYTTTVYNLVREGVSAMVHPGQDVLDDPTGSVVVVSKTITVPQTITATHTSECNGFPGQCVVRGVGTAGPYTTTIGHRCTTEARLDGNDDLSSFIARGRTERDRSSAVSHIKVSRLDVRLVTALVLLSALGFAAVI